MRRGNVSSNFCSRIQGYLPASQLKTENYPKVEDGNKDRIQDELKKLKQRLEELEFIKDFQQDLIAEFELETGKDLAKKFLPEQLATEIEEKKKLIKRGS